MDYNAMTKAELINEISRLTRLNEAMKYDIDHEVNLDYAWTGHLGNWYWDYPTNIVEFNDLKVTNLGYNIEEILSPIGFQFFTDKIHPEDYEQVMQNMRKHLLGKTPAYDVEYRIQSKTGDYKYYHDIGRVTKRDESGKPLFLAGVVFDITEKRVMLEELRKMNENLAIESSNDALTRILNHRGLYEQLQKLYQEKEAYQSLSIAMMDLDDFKNVNDMFGHLKGDEVLRSTATILKKYEGVSVTVGRYGGEEFLMIFKNKTKENVLRILEEVREDIESYFKKTKYKTTISIGYAHYKSEKIDKWLNRADSALYEAKRQGKNSVKEG